MKRWFAITAGIWLVAGSILFLHGALTSDGVAAAAFDWELRRGATIWPQDIYEGLLLILIFAPLVLLLGLTRSYWISRPATAGSVAATPRRTALWVGVFGTSCLLLAGLAFGHTLLLPKFDAPAVEIALDRIVPSLPIAEGQAKVFGAAHLELAVIYEEARGGGKTSIHRRVRRLIPITTSQWLPSEPVRIISEAAVLAVRDPRSGRYRSDREGDLALSTQSAGILLSGQVPGFIRMAFARKGVTLSPDALLQSDDSEAGRTEWHVTAALLGLLGAVLNFIAVIVYVAAPHASGRHRQ